LCCGVLKRNGREIILATYIGNTAKAPDIRRLLLCSLFTLDSERNWREEDEWIRGKRN
jgi:hypothetical protein